MRKLLRWLAPLLGLILVQTPAWSASPRPESIQQIAATTNGLASLSDQGSGTWHFNDGQRRQWQPRATFKDTDGEVLLVPTALARNGSWVATVPEQISTHIDIRSTDNSRPELRVQAPRAGVDALRAAGDDLLVALYADKLAAVWRGSTGTELGSFTLRATPQRVAASADGNLLAISQAGEIVSVFDLRTGQRWGDFELGQIPSDQRTIRTHQIQFLGFAYDNSLIIHHEGGYIQRLDPRESGRPALLPRQTPPLKGTATSLSPDGRILLVADVPGKLILLRLDANPVASQTVNSELGSLIASAWQPGSGRYALADDQGNVEIRAADQDRVQKTAGKHAGKIVQLAFSTEGRYLASAGSDGSIRLRATDGGTEAVRFVGLGDIGWLTLTPSGYFLSSGMPAEAAINVRIGTDVYGIGNFRERYYRPDIVQAALNGRSQTEVAALADTRPPPRVQVAAVPDTVMAETLMLNLTLTPQGGGIGDVRVLLNGSAVATSAASGERQAQASEQRQLQIGLVAGRNDIEVIAFNAENSLRSNPVRLTVTSQQRPAAKPVLHALVIGINEFADPSLNLAYAVNDASAVARALHGNSGDLYRDVRVELLATPASTTRTAIIDSLQRYQNIGANDVFLLHISTHGAVVGKSSQEQQYFLIPSNMGRNHAMDAAISQQTLKRLLGAIPASRKILLFDTCYAGALGQALYQTDLDQGTAGSGAANVLANAIGSTTLAASAPLEYSFEGMENHGLFTWVLLQGMTGQADASGRGEVDTIDLADYVAREVPIVAKRLNLEQNPAAYTSGQTFPVTQYR